MNESSAIISAFESLRGEGKPAALATVVSVAGSAYRRPGARMLIAEDGRTWGGVSGGCLERDVARRARGVLASGRAVMCRYETTDDQDLAAGVATGCRGTVDLFIEPLSRESAGPIPWLARASRERRPVRLATIVRTSNSSHVDRPGTRICLGPGGKLSGQFDGPELQAFCQKALSDESTGALPELARFNAADDTTTDVFVETLHPPRELVIFGAGFDVIPVVSMAKMMGWRVTVVGVRPATGLQQRFSQADELNVTSSEDPLAGVEVTSETAVVLMTHNYPRDLSILSRLQVVPRYLGILGPRVRTQQLFEELNCGGQSDRAFARSARRAACSIAQEWVRNADPTQTPRGHLGDNPAWQGAYSPVGLDLGAETSEEIALSIVAEIQAVLRSTRAGFLRDRQGPIHLPARDGTTLIERIESSRRVWREVSCPI